MPIPQVKNVHFHFLEKRFSLSNRTALKKFILKIFNREAVRVESVNYIFCTDEYLLGLNREYLKHDTYTDIITFQYSARKEPVFSDIYISVNRVRENAKLFNTSFLMELHRVIFHGALHLCGYKDKTKNDAVLMRAKENEYLSIYVSREKTKSLKD